MLLISVLYVAARFSSRPMRGRIVRFIILNYGRAIVRCSVWPFIRVKYEDKSGGADSAGIYVFNHRSASDAFLMAVLGKDAVQVVNGWPMRLPLFGHFAQLGEYIDSTQVCFEDMQERMRAKTAQGISILAFPEGTRSGSRRMNSFHSGIFHIARELRLPVYPCCIAGNENLPDRGFRFSGCGSILVRRLKPLAPEEVAAFKNTFLLKKRVFDIIRNETESMDKELDDAKLHARQ